MTLIAPQPPDPPAPTPSLLRGTPDLLDPAPGRTTGRGPMGADHGTGHEAEHEADLDADPGPGVGAVGSAALSPAEVGVLSVAFLVGIVMRWLVIEGPLGYIDLDEATAGLQARDFFASPAVFFPGQPYGGTPETFLVGLVHLVAGPGALTLKLVPMLLHLLACVLVWDTARRVVPSRGGQLVAPILLWLGPAAGVWESTKERGFYGAAIVVAAALVWLAARIDEAPDPAATDRRDVIGYGVLVGVGWWVSPLLVLVVVPTTVWLLVRDPARLGFWRPAGIAAVVGALPWFGWNLLHGFGSLRQPPNLGTDIVSRFGSGMGKLAVLTGIETPWDAGRTLVPWARGAAVLLVVVAVAGAFLRDPRTRASLAGSVVLGYLLLYPLANNTGTVGPDPRYLYPLLPALALAIAALIPGPRAEGGVWRAGVAILLAVAVSAWGLAGLDEARSGDVRFLEAPGTADVVRLLEDRGVTFATTDLAGAQITYATDGRVKASSFAVPRFPELERLTLVEQPSTYVLDAELYGNAERLERWLFFHGIPFERERHGVWVVILIDRWVPPWEPGMIALMTPVRKPH